MKHFNRPLSYHLFLYKTQITSFMSVLHRIAGFVLSFILFFNYIFILFIYSFVSFYYVHVFFLLFSIIFVFFNFFLMYTFLFHCFNGTRHICWDFCIGLNINNILKTGNLIFFLLFIFNFFFYV